MNKEQIQNQIDTLKADIERLEKQLKKEPPKPMIEGVDFELVDVDINNPPPKDTQLMVSDSDSVFTFRYFSHIQEGRFICFASGLKSNETECFTVWKQAKYMRALK